MPPEQDAIRVLLQKVRTVAVVGAKDAPGQPVDNVGRYLIEAGLEVYPVHPARRNVWGLTTYKSIGDLPGPVDMLDLFRAAEYCPGHAREALALPWKPLAFWMQLGIFSPEAATLLEKEGIMVVQDACLMVERRRLFPHGVTRDGAGRTGDGGRF
ncbi:MAG: CoA-binding protein [Spirochaetaceae bacterium]|jgi:predicted CoA-binding protein|nr:CoA-binding protein [Spirochaetaceae bacterium]